MLSLYIALNNDAANSFKFPFICFVGCSITDLYHKGYITMFTLAPNDHLITKAYNFRSFVSAARSLHPPEIHRSFYWLNVTIPLSIR